MKAKYAARSMSNEKQENLFELFSKYIYEDRALRDSTRNTHLSYLKNVQNFVDSLKNESKSPLCFDEVNLEFIKELHKSLSKTKSLPSTANIHFTLRNILPRLRKTVSLSTIEIHEGAKPKKPSLTTADIAAIGASICHVDKSDLIREWIGKIRKTNYTLEAWGKQLDMLVG